MKNLEIINNRLHIGGLDCTELAKKFGTPLYVLNERQIRESCRSFSEPLKRAYPDSQVVYASKALSNTAVYRIIADEGLGADVVSGGELCTALAAGFDPKMLYFHGCNKTKDEILLALQSGVHAIVIDSYSEAEYLAEIMDEINAEPINVLVRINPGVNAHTHRHVQTARTDSKFGVSISDGSALKTIKYIMSSLKMNFLGLHCHIGSQIFELEPYRLVIETFTRFAAENGLPLKEINIGGGAGIKYTEEDAPFDRAEFAEFIIHTLKENLVKYNIPAPKLVIEPGRAIVAEAGITLYTVGAVKTADAKKYVFVDGGMYDNPRYALYQAKYSAVLANRAAETPTETITIAGRCCESGDIIADGVELPAADRGDILAVLSTGAYNYSMASHYNRNFVPPTVLINNGQAEYIVKPETYEDLVRNDVIPERLQKNK